MNQVFADTSYYIALMSEYDQHHAAAVAVAQGFLGEIITTDFVLVEVGNWLCRIPDRAAFLKLRQSISADKQTTVIPATRELFDGGCSLFARRMDKEWSLTDCLSFTVMQQRGLVDALTADHHFEQAGFNVLLR